MIKFDEVIDSLESVVEEYRTAYEPDGDKFKLRDEFKPFASAITGLNTTLGKTSNDLKKANSESASRRAAMTAFEELCVASGISLEDGKPLTEALKVHLDTLTSQAKNGGELKVNMDNIRRDFEKKTREIEAIADGKVSKMNTSLERYLIGQQVTAALAKHKGVVDLLLPAIRPLVKVVPENDDYVVRVVDSEGNVRTDGKGGFLDVEGLVVELKKQPTYARAFESDAAGGSGARSPTREQSTRRTVDPSSMSPTQKIKSGLAKGLAQRARA